MLIAKDPAAVNLVCLSLNGTNNLIGKTTNNTFGCIGLTALLRGVLINTCIPNVNGIVSSLLGNTMSSVSLGSPLGILSSVSGLTNSIGVGNSGEFIRNIFSFFEHYYLTVNLNKI